jgi:hypothetical protein
MSETSSSQLPVKRRLFRAIIAFILGGIASSLMFLIGGGLTGAGHGIGSPVVVSGGIGGSSFFIFPFVCAGVASKWLPAMWVALAWECFHHVTSFFGQDSVLRLPDDFDHLGEDFLSVVFLFWLGLYVVAHLSVLFALWYYWQERRGAHELKSPSTHNFNPRD